MSTQADAAGPARVTVYGKPGCHLCEDVVEVVARVCEDLGTSYVEVDITTDPELQRRFGEQIPVTYVDGAHHDFWRVDERRLRAALGG
jgi:glutaredoxin